MLLIAAAHIGFWGWGAVLGLQAGAMDWPGAAALAVWLALIGLWLAIVGRLSRSGWLPGPGATTHTWLWVPAPTVTLSLIGLFLVPVLREAWFVALLQLPALAVPVLNTLRILAIGTVVKAWRGLMPRRIGYGVGIPDVAFGLWSLGIAAGGGFAGGRVALAWNLIGAAILLLMLPMVFTVLRPPRLDASGAGNSRAILVFPMVLAPAGLATLFLILHGLVLYAAAVGTGEPTGVQAR
jgi:hypothetical protein